MLLDSPIIPNNSRKLPRLQVASLASRWCLHFLLKSGGFGAFAISSGLVLGIFFYRLRQLPIAKYNYAESIPPVLLLNSCSRLVPRPCFYWKWVTDRKMLPVIPALWSVLAPAYYSPNYGGILVQVHLHIQSVLAPRLRVLGTTYRISSKTISSQPFAPVVEK